MKRKIVLSFVLVVAFALATSGMAIADTIALWNYNDQTTGISSTSTYTTGLGDQFPSANLGTGTQSNVGTMTWGYNSGLYPTGGTPPTYPADFAIDPATGLADIRYRAVDMAAGEGLLWTVSTAGYENIQIQLGVFSSTTNLNTTFSFDYWNGTSWIESTTASYAGNNTQQMFYLSPGADANNNAAFKFRFLLDTAAAQRTITYDWVEVTGTQVVPIPAAFWLLGSGLLGLVGIRRRMKK